MNKAFVESILMYSDLSLTNSGVIIVLSFQPFYLSCNPIATTKTIEPICTALYAKIDRRSVNCWIRLARKAIWDACSFFHTSGPNLPHPVTNIHHTYLDEGHLKRTQTDHQ
jgi:hypothetical protein